MTTERSKLYSAAVIGLLVLNLCSTGYLIWKTERSAGVTTASGADVPVSEAEAIALADDLVKLYNAKDDAGLYAKFDGLAKTQLTQEQLTTQLKQLYPLMGTISDPAFSNAAMAGSDAGRDYYTLNYKIRLTGGTFTTGDMKLTVTRRESGVALVGFFINGTSHSGGP